MAMADSFGAESRLVCILQCDAVAQAGLVVVLPGDSINGLDVLASDHLLQGHFDARRDDGSGFAPADPSGAAPFEVVFGNIPAVGSARLVVLRPGEAADGVDVLAFHRRVAADCRRTQI